VLRLADALAAAVSAGARLEDALAAVSSRPADLLGRPDLGRLRPGLRGDVVVLDDALTVVAVHVAGARVP
jgi:N-acetylglucosamine-6-phosphate deacetylase